MSSVTGIIKEVKQPRGGYLKPSSFNVHKIEDNKILNEHENIHATIIGTAVDYLTRFMMGTDVVEAFKISCRGAYLAKNRFKQEKSLDIASELVFNIKGLDDDSIINACKLVTFDVWYRNPMSAFMAKGVDEINPDKDTIENIRIMVERSVEFWTIYGPITKDGFTFEPNGYTETISDGDGDYLTIDTLWDFKVNKAKPTNKITLQLLIYWIMGQHSGQDIYENISKLGIFNPRLNIVYTVDVNTISPEIIQEIERDIICY